MLKYFIIFFYLINTSTSLINNNNLYKNNLYNNNLYKNNLYKNKIIQKINKRSSPIMVINNNLPPLDKNLKILDYFLDIPIQDKYIGKIIVETISAQLPNVDSIGHNVLRANNEFINSILNNSVLSEEMKKVIVLASIKLAIAGDNMGSTILQLYYDIVEKCL